MKIYDYRKRQYLPQINRVFDIPIEIQAKTIYQDEMGVEREEWKKVGKVFADVKNLYGKEYELAKQEKNEKTIKLVIRYGAKITTEMRLILDDKIYNIEHIDNINYKNEFIEIRAVEVQYART